MGGRQSASVLVPGVGGGRVAGGQTVQHDPLASHHAGLERPVEDFWPLLPLPDGEPRLPALDGAHAGGDPAVIPAGVLRNEPAQHEAAVTESLASLHPPALSVPGDEAGEETVTQLTDFYN